MAKIRLILFIFFCTMNAVLQLSFGQTVPVVSGETKKPASDTIEISEIPIRSVEVINQARQAFHDLIPANTILRMKVKNQKVLATVDTNLLKPPDPEDPTINLRYLENRKITLLQEQKKIKAEEDDLNEVIGSLDQLTGWLNEQSARWKSTRSMLLRDTLIHPVPEKVTYTIRFLDSCINLISKKNIAVMEILERTTAIGINIDLYNEKTIALIKRKQSHALNSDHPPFFRLNFTTSYGSDITTSMQTLWSVKLKNLGNYLGSHLESIFILLILFAGLVWFFYVLRKRIHVNLEGLGRFYKEMLLLILAHPFSAATILILIGSVFFFPDRPIIFREFSAYIVAYPLLILLNTILNRKYHLYLYLFSIIIVLYMILILVASETTLYRVFLLLIAITEIGLLGSFLLYFKKNTGLPNLPRRLVYFFILLHLVLAIIGLVANITGRIIMTEMVLNAVFNNITNGVLLFLSAIIINGVVAAGIDSTQGQKLSSFRSHGEVIKRRLIQLVIILSIFYWVVNILYSFRISDYVFTLIGSILTYRISIGQAGFSLDIVVIFFVVIYFSFLLAQLLRIILEEDVLSRFPLSKGLPHTIAMGVKYSLIVAGFLLAINAAGIPMDKLTIILGAFSVGIGFGLQNIFSNMVSGLILLFERPIQLGDTVQVGQLTGTVKSIDLRSSNVQTFDGAEVIVPNGQLVSNEVINWTLSDKKRRLEIPVGVAYASDPPFVHGLFIEILRGHPEILKDPEPLVFFTGLGESSLDFILLFWIGNYVEGRRIKSEVLFDIFKVLKENNVSIPFPQRDVHVKSGNG